MTGWLRWVLIGSLLASTACGPGGDGSRYSAEVLGPAQSGPEGSGRWVLNVELDEGTVLSSEVVQVAFDEAELGCDDGSGISPSAVPVGAHVRFVRVGDDADTMDPPIIGGRDLQVACQNEVGSRELLAPYEDMLVSRRDVVVAGSGC